MKRSQLLWALAAVNAMLLVGLSWKLGGENKAHAAMNAQGDYLMLPGRVPGFNNGMVYLIDSRSKTMVPFYYDNNRGGEIIAGQQIDLERIISAGIGVGGQNGKNPPRRP